MYSSLQYQNTREYIVDNKPPRVGADECRVIALASSRFHLSHFYKVPENVHRNLRGAKGGADFRNVRRQIPTRIRNRYLQRALKTDYPLDRWMITIEESLAWRLITELNLPLV